MASDELNAFRIIDENNLGDQVCGPVERFSEFSAVQIFDIRLFKKEVHRRAIIGGGGLLFHTVLDLLECATVGVENKLVIWGAGTNVHDCRYPRFPKFLDKYALVGLRDFGNPWEYVPCPSCLHPVFDAKRQKATRRHVIYEHFEYPIPISGVRMNNNKKESEFEAVITFLESGKTVITNTYHGAYWAMLLGRKVLLYKPFSNRFFGFKHQPLQCSEHDWTQVMKKARKPPSNYLRECQELNRKFSEKVVNLFFK